VPPFGVGGCGGTAPVVPPPAHRDVRNHASTATPAEGGSEARGFRRATLAKGRPAKVDHVRKTFVDEINRSEALVAAIMELPTKVRPSSTPGLHPKHKGQVIELAFMGLVATWEEFLVRSLARYLTGAKTDSGYKPTTKAGVAETISHAYALLSLDPEYKPAKSYLKLTDVKSLLCVANFYFSAHPYGCLQEHNEIIKYAIYVRNRVAHDSEKCKMDFKSAAIYFLCPPDGQLKQGYTPAALLQEPVRRHFGRQAVDLGKTHFCAYSDLFRQLAEKIVPLGSSSGTGPGIAPITHASKTRFLSSTVLGIHPSST